MSSKAAGSSTKEKFMSNIATSTPAINAMAAAVVSHDNAQTAATTAVVPSLCLPITNLVLEREVWENTVHRTSNDQLYGLLQKCYGMYKAMGEDTLEAATLRQALKTYVSFYSIKVSDTAHGLVKIIKCVFGDDRRRASAYGIVLRRALSDKISVADLPTFIRDHGGVEEIRLAKGNAMTAKQKATLAAAAVKTNAMGVFASEELAKQMDATNIGSNAVLIGTWQADGSVLIRAVVQNGTAVNAALAGYYSNNKDAVQSQVQQKEAANDAQVQQDAIALAAQAAVSNG
jgi:hypothetical protein